MLWRALGTGTNEAQFNAHHGRISDQLLTDTKRANDQPVTACCRDDLAQPFALHDRLAQAELGKDGAVTALHCPLNNVALVWVQDVVQIRRLDRVAFEICHLYFLA